MREVLTWLVCAFFTIGAIWVCNPSSWPFNQLLGAPQPTPSASKSEEGEGC